MSHVMLIHSDQADYVGILLYICIITMKICHAQLRKRSFRKLTVDVAC